jgi:tRNA-specific 2-thiouridylase
VLCNTHIKWEALLKRADMLDCEFIATGHYAQHRLQDNGRYVISRGLDLSKDQSYVLWGLSQESLARTRFPLGGFHKSDIRQMAIESDFVDIANKSESYEICFVPDNDYRSFLKRQVPGLEEQVDGGNFVLADGTIVGKHRGYPFYTIGQRKGLEIALGYPAFVLDINPETNTVILGEKDELIKHSMQVRDVNLMKYAELPEDFNALTKIRYKHDGSMSLLNMQSDGIMQVDFLDAVSGVAPGQSAVFYEGNDLVGGGFIKK